METQQEEKQTKKKKWIDNFDIYDLLERLYITKL